MTKADLIDEVSRLAELTRKDSEVIVETIFDSVVRSLRVGDKIEIRGFGSFRTRQRKPRVGRNPKTGERVEVPAKKIPFFKPSKELKDLVNTGVPASGRPRPRPPRLPRSKAGGFRCGFPPSLPALAPGGRAAARPAASQWERRPGKLAPQNGIPIQCAAAGRIEFLVRAADCDLRGCGFPWARASPLR